MSVLLSAPARWTQEYQRSLNGQLERALGRLNEFALLPAGGQAGQVPVKTTGKDFDVAWSSGTGWQIVSTFANGWTHYQDFATWGQVSYMRDALGNVRLRGLMRDGTLNGTAFVLPDGFRPEFSSLHVVMSNDVVGRLDVLANGIVVARPPAQSSYVSLNGITFVAHH